MLSLRRATVENPLYGNQWRLFLSMLSLRRATQKDPQFERNAVISIHALLAESDFFANVKNVWDHVFLSMLSLRRATQNQFLLA